MNYYWEMRVINPIFLSVTPFGDAVNTLFEFTILILSNKEIPEIFRYQQTRIQEQFSLAFSFPVGEGLVILY